MRRVLLLAVIATLAVPASATAHRTPLAVALGKAYRLWGVKPCQGHYRVRMVRAIEGKPWLAGQARFNTPTGRGLYTSPASTWTECELVLAAPRWTRTQVEMLWPQLCTTVLHEWGHLTGHVHTDEPLFSNAPSTPPETPEQRGVMTGGNGSTSDDLARCGEEP